MIGTILRRLFGAPETYEESIARKSEVERDNDEWMRREVQEMLERGARKKAREKLRARMNVGRKR